MGSVIICRTSCSKLKGKIGGGKILCSCYAYTVGLYSMVKQRTAVLWRRKPASAGNIRRVAVLRTAVKETQRR